MAAYNHENMEKSSVMKVFINPNFNRNIKTRNETLPTNNIMHINPKFSQYGTGKNWQSNMRIYINPNFIKTNQTTDLESKSKLILNKLNYDKNIKLQKQAVDNSSFDNKHNSILQPTMIKSRYCLVRQVSKLQGIQKLDETKTKVKISKYKSIRLNVRNTTNSLERNNTAHVKLPYASILNTTKQVNKKYDNMINLQTKLNSRFKLVKQNIELCKSDLNLRSTKMNKAHRDLKNMIKLNSQAKLKNIKGKLKKNNIPCPLFKKYGKCLRMELGNCEYMHDKKHVSICRKFLKGICHDQECLLSHELTLKKMPTCYFYLQGMCTKEGCPYLHVKLNEKTKVCADFIKGYCEKGDKCLNRHVNPNYVNKPKCLKIENKYKNKANKQKVSKCSDNTNKGPNQLEPISSTSLLKNHKENSDEVECRYYKDAKHSDNECEKYEIIKPSRCKLGTLPSFIKL
ncbi:uncharacterized protein LOC128199957 [Galleria mellonella]|uniref:Uncharacterized protein LOC128199957 n=1 Tax=Galleria mellonella TaxID=7137 RepID=A0ABM3MU82_GALME|nr:uncharacterized protein LOC128199957 [Galleria mellonella]